MSRIEATPREDGLPPGGSAAGSGAPGPTRVLTPAAEPAASPPASVPAHAGAAPSAASGPAARQRRRNRIALAALGLFAAAGLGYYVLHLGLESTDDAQIDADQVAVPARASGVVSRILFTENQVVQAGEVLAELDPTPAKVRLAEAEGNLEKAQADADSADADAALADINAHSNRSMAQAVLAEAESGKVGSHEQIAEGEARVAEARTRLQQAQLDVERGRKLRDTGAMAQAQLDSLETRLATATAALRQAEARLAAMRSSVSQAESRIREASARLKMSDAVEALIAQARAKARAAHATVATAEAARDLARIELSYTQIHAPETGVVSKKTIAVGQAVAAGQPIVQLVPTTRMWVTANFKETQLARMRPGQPARIEVDAFPSADIKGELESFSAGTGSRFTLLPPDNASGNYTKVVQRVPVRIKILEVPQGLSLRPGLSVEVTINTR